MLNRARVVLCSGISTPSVSPRPCAYRTPTAIEKPTPSSSGRCLLVGVHFLARVEHHRGGYAVEVDLCGSPAAARLSSVHLTAVREQSRGPASHSCDARNALPMRPLRKPRRSRPSPSSRMTKVVHQMSPSTQPQCRQRTPRRTAGCPAPHAHHTPRPPRPSLPRASCRSGFAGSSTVPAGGAWL